jgi:hypothetical protein
MEERTWTTKDGTELEISKMETSHIVNAVAMIERQAAKGAEVVVSYGYDGEDNYMSGDVEWVQGAAYLARIEEYAWLKEELQRRGH